MSTSHRASNRQRLVPLGAVALAWLLGACDGGSSKPTAGEPPALDPESPEETAERAEAVADASWASVAPGTFVMGSLFEEPCRDDDEMVRTVTVTRGFVIAATETTQGTFEAVMGYNPSFWRSCGPSCPVERVSWHEAAAFCNALSEAENKPACYRCTGSGPSVRCRPSRTGAAPCLGYRLPTEAEWEYAARAGSEAPVYAGHIDDCQDRNESLDRIAWYKNNSNGTTHPVAELAPNVWGLYDTAGNVSEWVADWYEPDWPEGPAVDPDSPPAGTERIYRGGDYFHNAHHCRTADRERFRPEKQLSFVGFRCVRTSSPTEGAGR